MSKTKQYFSELKPQDKHIFRDIAWLVGLFILVKIDSISLIPTTLSGIHKITPVIRTHHFFYDCIKFIHHMGLTGSLLAGVLSILIYIGVIAIGLLIYRHHAPSNEAKKLSKLFTKPTKNEIKLYFLSIVLIFASNAILGSFNKIIYGQNTTENNAMASKLLSLGGITTFVIGFSVVVLAPIAEESMFRGAFINVFFNKSAKFLSPSVISCGFVFSCFHMSTTPISFLIYMIPGMFLAYAYEKSGTLKESIAIHMTINAIALIFMFATA